MGIGARRAADHLLLGTQMRLVLLFSADFDGFASHVVWKPSRFESRRHFWTQMHLKITPISAWKSSRKLYPEKSAETLTSFLSLKADHSFLRSDIVRFRIRKTLQKRWPKMVE